MDKYRTVCVNVRSAAGIPTQYDHLFLKFIYLKPHTDKRISAKSEVARRLSGNSLNCVLWENAFVCLPLTAETLEIELWNEFHKHDLYLGLACVSLSSPTSDSPMWISVNGTNFQGMMTMPINLEVVITNIESSFLFPSIESTKQSVSCIDPSFQFKIPMRDIEWEKIARTNVSEIFFTGNTDCLMEFKNEVMYGNTLANLDMVIDKEFEKSFQMCQYSAQYLQSCIDLLSKRCTQYVTTREELLHQRDTNKKLRSEKKVRSLMKQLAEYDVLINAYEAISKTLPQPPTHESPIGIDAHEHQLTASVPAAEAPSSDLPPHDENLSSTPQNSPPKAPMLMSYEERMEKHRQEKEASRAQRVAEEKARLVQIMVDQNAKREWREKLISDDKAFIHRSANILQTWFCHVTFRYRYREKLKRNRAVITIQCMIRRRNARLKLVRLRALKVKQVEELIVLTEQLRVEHEIQEEVTRKIKEKELKPILCLWTDIQVAFCRAKAIGSNVFEFFDVNQDGMIDRAEFRRQLQRLGFDVPRQIVRRLIQLIHDRNGISSERLLVNSFQFMSAFDLDKVQVLQQEPTINDEEPKADANPIPQDQPKGEPATVTPPPSVDSVEGISLSFRTLRQNIIDGARKRFGGGESYHSLRAALIKLFGTFDVNGAGEVSLNDLKGCIEDQLGTTITHLEYLKECFDSDGSGSLNIAEFVSSAFADSSVDEMGVLGYQLRDAILNRVKIARKESPTIEDAVRLVFNGVFRHKDEATFADFCHALYRLDLGFKMPQLSRLALRLDQDKNHFISLDELMIWLRLRNATPQPKVEKSAISAESKAVKSVRRKLLEMAGGNNEQSVRALFQKLHANGSANLNATELHVSLGVSDINLSDVQLAVSCMDSQRKCVVSSKQFISFCLEKTSDAEEEVGVLVENCRAKLLSHFDSTSAAEWFQTLSQEGKLRTGELKRALKSIVRVADHEMDAIVHWLDQDKSEWISASEFSSWLEPVRDIEVLLQLVEGNPKFQQVSDLFQTFDLDGNGAIGIEEFHAGLKRYHIAVNKDEAALLLKEFDVDGDGVLNAAELNAIAETYSSADLDDSIAFKSQGNEDSIQGIGKYDEDEFESSH